MWEQRGAGSHTSCTSGVAGNTDSALAWRDDRLFVAAAATPRRAAPPHEDWNRGSGLFGGTATPLLFPLPLLFAAVATAAAFPCRHTLPPTRTVPLSFVSSSPTRFSYRYTFSLTDFFYRYSINLLIPLFLPPSAAIDTTVTATHCRYPSPPP